MYYHYRHSFETFFCVKLRICVTQKLPSTGLGVPVYCFMG